MDEVIRHIYIFLLDFRHPEVWVWVSGFGNGLVDQIVRDWDWGLNR